MKFTDFQSATGTLKKTSMDGYGNPSVDDSLSVEIDPTFGWTRTFTRYGEAVEGQTTIITGTGLQAFYDESHFGYVLTYNGKDWQVENPVPFYKIGTDTLEHLEVVLR